jgi:hypothetical protein
VKSEQKRAVPCNLSVRTGNEGDSRRIECSLDALIQRVARHVIQSQRHRPLNKETENEPDQRHEWRD